MMLPSSSRMKTVRICFGGHAETSSSSLGASFGLLLFSSPLHLSSLLSHSLGCQERTCPKQCPRVCFDGAGTGYEV